MKYIIPKLFFLSFLCIITIGCNDTNIQESINRTMYGLTLGKKYNTEKMYEFTKQNNYKILFSSWVGNNNNFICEYSIEKPEKNIEMIKILTESDKITSIDINIKMNSQKDREDYAHMLAYFQSIYGLPKDALFYIDEKYYLWEDDSTMLYASYEDKELLGNKSSFKNITYYDRKNIIRLCRKDIILTYPKTNEFFDCNLDMRKNIIRRYIENILTKNGVSNSIVISIIVYIAYIILTFIGVIIFAVIASAALNKE